MGRFRRVSPPAIVGLSAEAARRVARTGGFRRTAVPPPAPDGPVLLWSWDADTGVIADWAEGDPDWAINTVSPIYGDADLVPTATYMPFLADGATTTAPVSGIATLDFRFRADTALGAFSIGSVYITAADYGLAMVHLELGADNENVPRMRLSLNTPDGLGRVTGDYCPFAFDTTYRVRLVHDARGPQPIARLLLGGVEVSSLTDESGAVAGPGWFPSWVEIDGRSDVPSHWQAFAFYDGEPEYVTPPVVPPELLWAEDFEDGTLDAWDTTEVGSAIVVGDADPIAGVYSLVLSGADYARLRRPLFAVAPASGVATAVLTLRRDSVPSGGPFAASLLALRDDATDARIAELLLLWDAIDEWGVRGILRSPLTGQQAETDRIPLPDGPLTLRLVHDARAANPRLALAVGSVSASATDVSGEAPGIGWFPASFTLDVPGFADLTADDVAVYDGLQGA
jgi:hypothetical protein